MARTLFINFFILFTIFHFSCSNPEETDNTPPTVTITFPQDGSIVSKITIITCVSTDNEKVEKVELWVDGVSTGVIDENEPYALEWNTTTYQNSSSHTITVRSYDTSNNKTDSNPIILTVDNINLYPPAPLKMVEKTIQTDTTLLENGIDAISGSSNAIQVVWYRYSGLNIIKKFNLYRSSDPTGDKNFTFLNEIYIEDNFSQDTSFLDNNVNLYTYYHYFVTVVDEDNQESFPSDTVKYKLLDKAEVSDLGLTYNPGDTIVLQFDIPTTANAGGFILRIERTIGLTTRELVYIDYVEDFFESGTIFWELPTDKLEDLSRSIEYRWRIDLVAGNILAEGSESNWAYFTVDWGN